GDSKAMRNKLFASAKGVINLSWCIAVLFLFVAAAANGTSSASSIPQISAGLQSSPWLTKGDTSACPEQFESISGIEPANTAKIQVQENYGKLPLYFIQNDGQMNEKVKYYEKGSGHAMFFTEKGVYLLLTSGREQDARNQKSEDINQKQDASRISVPLVSKGGSNGKTGKVAIKFKTQNEKYKIRSSNSDTPKSKLSTGNSQLTTTRLVKLILLGANKCPEIVAEGLQECKVNYFIGNDRGKWQTNIPTYSAVVYKNIYDGIDLKFYGSNRQLEYDIIVKPGADPSKVRFTYEGIEDLQVNNNGDLEIILSRLGEAVHTQQTHAVNSPLARGVEGVSEYIQKQSQESTFTNGDLRNDGFVSPFAETQDRLNPSLSVIQKKPYVYQEIDGKKVEIGGRFEIQQAKGQKQESRSRYSKYLNPKSENQNRKSKISHPKFIYSFQVAAYDEHHPLVIDPTLVFSTYLGGSRSDSGYGIAVDTSGNAYVTGSTASFDFPTASAIYGSNTGEYYYNDSFIAKLNASGSNLEYSTYLGGNGTDFGWGIAVDTSGNAYVVGYTESSDFPMVNPAFKNNAGYTDAFVTKLNSSGGG
ncbi:MAG: SBBP repeat-containing protein, partial [Bacteroidota bacterium]